MRPDARRTKRTRTKKYDKAESALAQSVKAGKGRSKSGRARRRSAPGLLGAWILNPYLSFLLLIGVGMATLRVDYELRLALLWLVLLALVLLYAETGRLKADYSLLNLARGALLGTVVALPFFLFAKDFFYATASRLYRVENLQVLVERAVFLVPLLEESFFRGLVQRERGLRDGALLFGLMQVLYFFPEVSAFPLVIASMFVGMTLLGLLYGYMHQRYGLTASIGCHVAVNSVLLVFPSLLKAIGALLAF
jgi:membrane protease YdiL (CAAX protease family)